MITLEEFQKLDLRVGTITEVKNHPEADRLYILKVNFGEEERQLVAGLKEFYEEKELLKKQVIVVMNLQPVKFMGVESQGMLLAAGGKNQVAVLTTDKK